jgi:hypothetical protein
LGVISDAAQSHFRAAVRVRRGPQCGQACVIVPLISGGIWAIDSTLPVTGGSFDDRVARLNERPRFNAALISLFAGIGIVLELWGVSLPCLPARCERLM